jgi:radical SAM protein with 4Fe4S-binding SPASM domain
MFEASPSARLNALTLERNIPVSVTIELTRRCPLGCLHCYLPETRGRARHEREMTTAQWKDILSQLAEAGTLYLVFTGGEPLLRPDLVELCAYAKKLNFDVRIFSTGLGLDKEAASGLKRAGVSGFEISFYGRPFAHDGITGVKGSFARSLGAARILKKSGVPVKIKTPLMKQNLAQAGWLRSMAKREGFEISFDPLVTAANDGDPSALKLRLSGRQLSKAVKLYGAAQSSPSPAVPLSFDLLCGAGRNVCAVGPGGEVYPCLQLPVKLGSLARRRFCDIWGNAPWLKKWRGAGVKDLKACAACPDAAFCSRCPGVSLVEEGDIFAPNKPACQIARANGEMALKSVRRPVS